MPSKLPEYYTGLKPFAALFASGTPCLMYHKLGPRPPGVRLKGVGMSPPAGLNASCASCVRAGFQSV